MTAPAWAVGADQSIHTIPGSLQTPQQPPLSWQQVQATGQFLLDVFIGRIAIAFGGIEIFGWRPLDFLVDWGEQRIADAEEAFARAMNAQGTATFANSQVTVLTGGALATEVTDGVAVNAQFNEASANTLVGFSTRVSDGPGAGYFGPDGTGKAVWKKSGGLWRRHVDIFDTPLATDYQTVYVVMSTPPDNPYLGGDAYIYLIARSNAAGTEFVWARIGNNDLAVGKTVGGTVASPWVTTTTTTNAGDQWAFIVGTDGDDRQMLVKQNGVTRIDHTDATSSALCSDAHATVADHDGSCTRYYQAGVGSLAADRAVIIVPFLDQTRPGELDLWSAADREPTTY